MLKKTLTKAVAVITLFSFVAPVFAQDRYDVYVKFADGGVAKYANLVDGPTALDDLSARVKMEHPNRPVVEAKSVLAQATAPQDVIKTSYARPELIRNQYMDNTVVEKQQKSSMSAGDLAIGVIAVLVGAGLLHAALSGGASQGNSCDYSWQTAKDGSRCGNRAASVRPGGR